MATRFTVLGAVLAILVVLVPTAGAQRKASQHGAPAPHATAARVVRCDLSASPSGSDGSGDGSAGRPFRSVARLDRALRPGKTGCLRAGVFGNTGTWHQLNNSGSASGQITITSYPGETATIVGYVDIEGSYTILSDLQIDGSNTLYTRHPGGVSCPAPTSEPLVIAGHDDILQYVDYYQSKAGLRGNGIGIGFWGNADNTIIRHDKIHDVGQCQAYDHLIYLSHGNNVQIYDNWLWNDPHGRGVQLYPAPTNARIWGNVIDHAGEGFVIGNERGQSVSGNQIYSNIITNTTGLPTQGIRGEAIHDLYGGTPGTGNSFHNNLLYNNPGGLGRLSAVRAYGNVTGNPHFVDPARHNYRLPAGSPSSIPGPR